MTVTALEKNAALILIDFQEGIRSFPTIEPLASVAAAARGIADAFRDSGRPVLFVNVAGGAPGRTDRARAGGERPSNWADIVPELARRADEPLFTKKSWGAFSNTELNAYLEHAGVGQVVLAGVATSMGVESTARQAHELGYHVVLAIDAMTDVSADAHENSVARIFPMLGESGSGADIAALAKDGTA